MISEELKIHLDFMADESHKGKYSGLATKILREVKIQTNCTNTK